MVVGDSLVRDLAKKFAVFPEVRVRVYRGAYIETLIEIFTTGFVESEWQGVKKVFLLIGTNHTKNTEVEYFEKKYTALVQIVRARLGNIELIVCTIPPRPRDFENWNWKCKEFNFAISRAAVKAKAILYPLHKAFLFEGLPRTTYFCDGLHFSRLGTNALTKAVKGFWH